MEVFLKTGAEGWIVPEAINCHGSFTYVPTFESLIAEYYTSIGRGANLLNALVPDKQA